MGYWFRPLIAGNIAEGGISGREAFILVQALMEFTDDPKILVKFEKMCIGMLGLADLRERLKVMEDLLERNEGVMQHMKKIQNVGGEFAQSVIGALLGQMSVSYEDGINRLKREIQVVKQMISKEQYDAGEAISH